MSSDEPTDPEDSNQRQLELVKYVIIAVIVIVGVVSLLVISGPTIGNVFSGSNAI
jgi:hypothetical protein